MPGAAVAENSVHVAATSAPLDVYEHDDAPASARDVTAMFADYGGAYVEEHTARLEGFGVTDIRAKLFQVNEPLTELTRGPVGQ